MALLTVPQAAKRLGVSPRTVTYWIKDKQRLKATQAAHGHHKLLIEESEIERLIAEIAQEQPEQEEQVTPGQTPDKPESGSENTRRLEQVEHWVSDLQRWHSELEKRIEVLEQGMSIAAHQDGEPISRPVQTQKTAKKQPGPGKAAPPAEIPSGSVGYKAFAEQHGVNERTARDQIDKSYIPAFVRARPSNPRFKERWLRPEDQQAAIQFWQSHETSGFTPCSECPHEKSEALESS